MTELRNYLDSHSNLRIALVAIGFLVASVALFMGMAMPFLVQGADNLLIVSSLIVALALDLGIGWTLHLHTRRGLWATILLSSVGILLGAVLTSMAVWRGHWPERRLLVNRGAGF
jgi:hypothetical protein